MRTLLAFIVVGLFASVTGCQTADRWTKFVVPWGCEDLSEAKARFDRYKHVFMICISEDHWEDRGPHALAIHHVKGTVVRIYKGDWRVSERISFLQGFDYRSPNTTNAEVGVLGFVFTDQHADTEIGLDTGEFIFYGPELVPALDLAFPRMTKAAIGQGIASDGAQRSSDAMRG